MNVLLLTFIAIFIVLLVRCDNIALEESTDDEVNKYKDVEDTLNKLNNASTIKAKESLFSIGDKWTIFVYDEEIGVIQGKFVYLIGNTYSFYINNGSLVERENVKIAKIFADIYSNKEVDILSNQ